MQFGIFDHLDRNGLPLAAYYEQRLKLIEAYDRAGFYSYHLAEHHFTPLGMAPSPSVFLASIAQRTKRLRFGPLVFALPLHHPLRVLEEICMLDHLSNGRLDIGFGRGSVPYEISLLRAERRDPRKDLSRAAGDHPQGIFGRRAQLQGRVRQLRKRADGDQVAAAAASADLLRRTFGRERGARRPQGPQHHQQRHHRGDPQLRRALSRGVARR